MAKELFLRILRCAIQGEVFQSETEITEDVWTQIFELGRIHKVLPFIFDSAYRTLEESGRDISAIRKLSKQMMFSQAAHTASFINILEKLYKNHVPAVVVKGITCRRLYKNPDLRVSSDEDILVDTPHLSICEKLLLDEGFSKTTPSSESRYEHSYRRADGLHIEVHRTLFSDENKVFTKWNKLFENAETTTFLYEHSSCPIVTFSPDYNLLYLILHALKHFINTGVGIRQICDIATFSKAYQNEINWDFISLKLSESGGLTFSKAIFSLADAHLGFDSGKFLPEIFLSDIPDTTPLLRDILDGGVYGTATLSRAHSRSFTENAAQGKKTSVLSRLFPSPNSIKSRYGYAKNPLLLPVAYCHRVIRYTSELIKTKNNGPVSAIKIGARRVELLKFYSIIETEK